MPMKSSSVSEDDIRRPRGVQREDVWAAADAVLLAGEKPTIERVRQHLGSGSPNTVGPLLEQWFKHLGRRIQDPGAFAAPTGVPDPVLVVAQHFWETALAQTRGDFEQRLREGLADAVANVESEKERAEIAGAAAFEASAKATKLTAELAEQGALLQQVHEEHAADRARLQEVRATLTVERERLIEERQRTAKEVLELKQQLAAAIERADAADRRVALELDRERNARAKAERHVETLQKAVAAAREAHDTARELGRQQLIVANQREETLQTRLALAQAELVARQRLEELRAIDDAKSAEVTAAATEVAGLRASVERLTSLIDTTGVREPAPRKRSIKSSPRSGSSNS